jgi:excinuclease ABC subunit C
MTQSLLDDIPGIGPKRKKALVQHFGSARAIRAAGVEDLCQVEGINRATAQAIYDWFYSA